MTSRQYWVICIWIAVCSISCNFENSENVYVKDFARLADGTQANGGGTSTPSSAAALSIFSVAMAILGFY